MGALTTKPFSFQARPWELTKLENFDISDSFGFKIRFDIKENTILRVLPITFSIPGSQIFKNFSWITDRTRFAYEALDSYRVTLPMVKYGHDQGVHHVILRWEKFLNYLFYIFIRYTHFNLVKTNSKLLEIPPKKDEENFLSIQFISGDFTNFKDLILLKKLSHLCSCASCAVENIDINLLNFRPDSSCFFFNISFLEKCDNLFLINFNIRMELPILSIIFRKLIKSNNNLNIFSTRRTLELDIPVIYISSNFSFIQSLLEGKNFFSVYLFDFYKTAFLFGESCLLRSDFIKLFEYISGYYFVNYNLNIKYFIMLNSLGNLTSIDFGFISQQNKIKNTAGINYSLGYKFEPEFTTNLNIIQSPFFHYFSNRMGKVDLYMPVCGFGEIENIYRNSFGDLMISKPFLKKLFNKRIGWQILFLLIRKKLSYEKKEQFNKFSNMKTFFPNYFKENNFLFNREIKNELNYWISDFEENGLFWIYNTNLTNFYKRFKDLSLLVRGSVIMIKAHSEFEKKGISPFDTTKPLFVI